MPRGRKPSSNVYFGPVEENAVVRYLNSDDQMERNSIYNQFLRKPLNKMIESIIRKYGLYRKAYSFEELHEDTLSFLITKAHKFESSRSTKAYSYYGTICKHYILGLLIKDEKVLKQLTSYEDIYEIDHKRNDLMYEIDDTKLEPIQLISAIADDIRKDVAVFEISGVTYMTENERKIGEELINILENWEIIISAQGGNKYNKNTILSCLREGTHLNTKDIRLAIKRYKVMYKLMLQNKIKEGLI